MSNDPSLQERQFEFDKVKAERDYELRKLELALKDKETGWGARLFSPLTTTLLAGILTLAASALGTLLQGQQTLNLEREKFEATRRLENEKFTTSRTLETQKQQHELVLKMIAVADPAQGRQNLQFLAESGLINDEALANKLLASKTMPLIPPPASTGGSLRTTRLGCTYEFVKVATGSDAIRILGNWEQENIVNVEVPQLQGVRGGRSTIPFHKVAAEALKAAWLEIEQNGLLDRVISWDGAFVKRTVRGSNTVLSNHACGTAFDINVASNAFGRPPATVGERGSVRELVPIFEKHGFFWGGNFAGRPEGGHFEFRIAGGDSALRSDSPDGSDAAAPPQ